jgi:glycosyltransferase involved in cell wall biosynthesis
MSIPRLIHQIWRDEAVPERYRAFRDGWARLHPDWAPRLWTDDAVAELLERHYPELMPLYRGYPAAIQRADLGRYAILHHLGGVYADLDCECLKPIEPLLEGADLVLGAEPEAHFAAEPRAATAGFDHLLCASFIASAPGHAFWPDIFGHAVQSADAADRSEATGSLLLTRTWSQHRGRTAIRILPANQVYPVARADCWSGRVHDLEFWETATRSAHVLHHWDGLWFRPEVWGAGLPADIPVGVNRADAPRAGFDHAAGRPLISCLMAGSGALGDARLAIEAYLRQTYLPRELIMVARAPDLKLLAYLRALDRQDIRLQQAEPETELADLRNLGLGLASGAVVCRWAQTDLHDPRRLEVQYEALKAAGAYACLARRWVAWRPEDRRLGVVDGPPLATSLMALKSAMPNEPPGGGADNDPVVDAFLGQVRVALVDLSRLIAWTNGAQAPAAKDFAADRYDAVIDELAKRLPMWARSRPPVGDPPGLDIHVRLFGHFSSTTGIGASSRGTAESVAEAGLSFDVVHLPWLEEHPQPVPVPPPADPAAAGRWKWPVNIVHMNPGDVAALGAQAIAALELSDDARAFTVGIWAWETPNGVPASWLPLYSAYDEIWAPSTHTAAAVSRTAPVPVVVMPHVIAPPPPRLGRAALGWPEAAFIFLFVFDALSHIQRKNPAAVIAAYRAAFPEPSAAVMLILKARSLAAAELADLVALAGGRPDIAIVTEAWPGERLFAALDACDAYVSLHRAEGFGRTMAEAMAYGKPVIATAWSGNMDFMSDETAYLVPYRLTQLAVADRDFAAGSIWAEPNIGEAAAKMAYLVSHRAEAAHVGQRAAQWIRINLSATAVGQLMRQRLVSRRYSRPAVSR